MAQVCHCTNQCPACGCCCQVDCGHRRAGRSYTSPNTTPIVPHTTPTTRRPEISLQPRKPLTEEGLERILKAAFAEAVKELAALLASAPREERR